MFYIVQVIEFVRRHVGDNHTPLLAGNSVYTDYIFLKVYGYGSL